MRHAHGKRERQHYIFLRKQNPLFYLLIAAKQRRRHIKGACPLRLPCDSDYCSSARPFLYRSLLPQLFGIVFLCVYVAGSDQREIGARNRRVIVIFRLVVHVN